MRRRLSQDEAERLQEQIDATEPGEFRLRDLYGDAWEGFPIGEKVDRGRAFLEAVRQDRFPEVEDLGKRSGGRV
ncbi:DUF1413 domain-containing protein [Palleronia sp.]|uniref:DUF1413 domain-containing protein n=1 Tax=Palleronia sp. TaxID=1940284 RepID=UPI0035C8018A